MEQSKNLAAEGSKQEVSKANKVTSGKEQKPAGGISKSQNADPRANRDMLKESDYDKGAHDAVGEDARHSRQEAVKFQKSTRVPKSH